MPELRLIVASGTAQRRLLSETVRELESKGYTVSARQEGGEWQSLLADNMSGGLFDENRSIVVDSAELLGPLPESFGSMIEKESSVAIVLVYSAEPTKLLSKEILKRCRVLRPEAFPRWANERQRWLENAAREMNIKLSRDACALLVELIDDPEELRAQLTTLRYLCKGRDVTMAEVEAMSLDDGSKNLLRLLDGICEGKSIQAVKSLLAMAKNAQAGDLIKLTVALHNRMRLAWYICLCGRKSMLFKDALAAKDYAWRKAEQAARRYGTKAVNRFVLGLMKLNIDEKSGLGAGWFELERLVAELIGRN